MGPGGPPGLQNRAGAGDPGAGGFDSHAPSPIITPVMFAATMLMLLASPVATAGRRERAPVRNIPDRDCSWLTAY